MAGPKVWKGLGKRATSGIRFCLSKAGSPLNIDTFRRDARVVEWDGLENRCAARYPGFESLSLRFIFMRHVS